MKLPKIYKRDNYGNDIQKTIIEVEKLPELDYVPDVDIDDEKSVERYVKAIKSNIRTSLEYKDLMKFLKEKLHYDHCFFMPNIKKKHNDKVTIEMHHTALVMEDIIKIVLRKRYCEGESYDVQAVSNEVMFEHYIGDVSLTALSATAHDLIHEDNSCLFIPIQMCDFGDSRILIDKYKEWVPKEMLQKFSQYVILSEAIQNIDDIIPHDLDRHYVYYHCKDGVDIPDANKIMELIGDVE